MFFGNSTSAEAIAIQDARIVARAQSEMFSRAPILAAMRETGVAGVPELAPISGANDGFWQVGEVPGSAPIQPGGGA